MTETPEELAAVEQLLAERDALHGWLTRLDQAPVAAPDGVRERVRRDYQQRLDQLTSGLRAHADVIASKLRDDRREHDDLDARASSAREALAEAELRHAVGEYDADRFNTERTRHASDIETYSLSLGAMAERIARLEEVHRLVERAPRSPIETAEEDAVDPPPSEIHVISEVDDELVAIADLAPDANPEDVLAIFEDDISDPNAAPKAPASAPTTPETVGPLSFRPTAAGDAAARSGVAPPARQRPTDSAAPLGIPSANVPPRFVRPGERIRAPSSPPAPPATRVPPAVESPAPVGSEMFTEEIVASGPAAEPAPVPVGRTLRCGECGAMNRPLEWYCEKCGAELTAV